MKPENLTTLSGRIEYICYKKRIKQSELASLLGVSSTAIYKIVSGATQNPSMDLLLGFYQKLDINLLWLATGEGEMDAKALSSKSADNGSFGNKTIELLESRIEELKDQLGTLKYTISLQRQILDSSAGVSEVLGKTEGAINRPLTPNGLMFSEIMRQYKMAGRRTADKLTIFFTHPVAKVVAP